MCAVTLSDWQGGFFGGMEHVLGSCEPWHCHVCVHVMQCYSTFCCWLPPLWWLELNSFIYFLTSTFIVLLFQYASMTATTGYRLVVFHWMSSSFLARRPLWWSWRGENAHSGWTKRSFGPSGGDNLTHSWVARFFARSLMFSLAWISSP